jgi:predicted RNase H-like nuclease (RuvC/YqgF family)
MGLIDLFRKKEQAAAEVAGAARAKLLAEYAELLQREADPRPGDEERLAELVQELGFSLKQVECHLIIISEGRRLKERYDVAVSNATKAAALRKEMEPIYEKFEELRKELQERGQKAHELEAEGFTAKMQTAQLDPLVKRYPELLSFIGELNPEMLVNDASSRYAPAAIQNASRDAGLELDQVFPR